MKNNGSAVLLINLGTPDSPSTKDVRKYLYQFLNDERVIDINPVLRFVLFNLIVIPLRAPKSAKLYKEIWDKNGSPLLYHGEKLKEKVQLKTGETADIYFAMRYQNPNIKNVLSTIKDKNYSKLVIIPLYPQPAMSTTASSIDYTLNEIRQWNNIPEIKIINHFYTREDYLQCVVNSAAKYNIDDYDHVLFSFHGIPERHIKKCDPYDYCLKDGCCNVLNAKNEMCYKAACHFTARQVAEKLHIPKEKFTLSFQSRLGRTPWIKPYSDKVIEEFAKKGMKKLLVFSPAFVADCLETIHEIGTEYQELFEEHGGEKVQLVESLNSNEDWVNVLSNWIHTELKISEKTPELNISEPV